VLCIGLGVKKLLGVVFLLAQVGLIGRARVGPARWLCWAPNDYATQYRLQVVVGGRALTREEVARRYHLDPRGWYENPPANLMHVVRQYEETYGCAEHAQVALAYRLNGRAEQHWLWPAR
jgi:hypothetical protein